MPYDTETAPQGEDNPFKALALALSQRGDDDEQLARELAHAFADIVMRGTTETPVDELCRFLTEPF